MTDSRPNTPEFTVSELSFSLKRAIEEQFGHVRVRGEISGYRGPHSSGHAYFRLKDDSATLEAVVWRGAFGKLKFRPEEGMEVIATGKLTTFPGSSKYQIVIDQLEPAGVGALMALLEERKRKLTAEGLFDSARKRALPSIPRVIGVVTSPTGAVIRDILHRIADRFPVDVLVWPVRVQGETSAAEVAAAIRGFNALPAYDEDGVEIARPDVLIVARGGGSLEDLWGFNEEIVVRAVAASEIPVVSAVGHETDWTLIDLVADLRAPTPTGAAEMVVPVRSELIASVDSLRGRLAGAIARGLERRRADVKALSRAMPPIADLVSQKRQRLDFAASRLSGGLSGLVKNQATRLARVSGRIGPASLSRAVAVAGERLSGMVDRRDRAMSVLSERRRAELARRAARLTPDDLARRIERGHERADAVARRLTAIVGVTLDRARARHTQAAALLNSLSYKRVVQRGYAVLRAADGTPLDTVAALITHGRFTAEVKDGAVAAVITDGEAPEGASREMTATKPRAAAQARTALPSRRRSDGTQQGSLF